MRKIILSLIVFVGNMCMEAQVIKIYQTTDDGASWTRVGDEYVNANGIKYKVVFEEYHEYVDLGLPSGTLWATCNIGAVNPEDAGYYFAWGETTGYGSDPSDGRTFDWAGYKWMNSGNPDWNQINKYTFADNQKDGCWYNDGTFVGDGVKKLEDADDAAIAKWGSDWCIPTHAQQQELKANCYWQWSNSYNGKAGYIVYKAKGAQDKGKLNGSIMIYTTNDTHIFLPASGLRKNSTLNNAGTYGYYWSSEIFSDFSDYAYILNFYKNFVSANYSNSRYMGHPIRPVRSAKLLTTVTMLGNSPRVYVL